MNKLYSFSPPAEILSPALPSLLCLLSCMVDATKGFLLKVTSSLGSEATAGRQVGWLVSKAIQCFPF